MEVLVEYYFEQFDNLPRNGLHDRRKRRNIVEYFSTLIEGCRIGENQADPQENARKAIVGILRYHEEKRAKNGGVCQMGKYHNILYVGLKLAYDWQLKDTPTIVALLEDIFACERTFERIFIGALFGGKAPHYIAGWKSDFLDQEENLQAMVYFIDHATVAGLELEYDGKLTRFIDIPIESCGKVSPLKIATQLYLPDKIHILLRYGALIPDEKNNLIEFILGKLVEFNGKYPYNLVACLQLFLRAVDRIRLDEGEFIGKYRVLLEDYIVPSNRCGLNVPELRHLCRVVIRGCLWENFQLPAGIRCLPVPEKLWRYLDIMED